ncbi:hypothetical protein WICMUC_002912 [Wickerhamomyces mucosus]|uniref:Uncharacterized protein n=1 Tax=Wickerhamomyces mucosus TaxID=1378264 RepID=A0A9P8TDZ3_9ASCO|nr:hypothetical protein WICMUC_002912 [Wickerhamomyces mucosus]
MVSVTTVTPVVTAVSEQALCLHDVIPAEPVAVEPVVVEPVAVEPVAVEPVAVEPVAVEPVALEPVDVEPLIEPTEEPTEAPIDLVAVVACVELPSEELALPVTEDDGVLIDSV